MNQTQNIFFYLTVKMPINLGQTFIVYKSIMQYICPRHFCCRPETGERESVSKCESQLSSFPKYYIHTKVPLASKSIVLLLLCASPNDADQHLLQSVWSIHVGKGIMHHRCCFGHFASHLCEEWKYISKEEKLFSSSSVMHCNRLPSTLERLLLNLCLLIDTLSTHCSLSICLCLWPDKTVA